MLHIIVLEAELFESICYASLLLLLLLLFLLLLSTNYYGVSFILFICFLSYFF